MRGVAVAGQQFQLYFLLGVVKGVEHALLGRDDRGQFREGHFADRQEVALSL